MLPPVIVTAPATAPIDATTAIARAPALAGTDDAVVDALIASAVAHLDGWSGILGRCIVTQTWRQDFDGFCRILRLPFPNVSEIVSVTYDGGTAVDASTYRLLHDGSGAYLVPAPSSAWPSASESVSVEFKAGYGDADAVPAALKHAIVLMVSGLHRLTREGSDLRSETVDGVGQQQFANADMMAMATDRAVDRLLGPYRRVNL